MPTALAGCMNHAGQYDSKVFVIDSRFCAMHEQAMGRAKQRKRKRYSEVESAADAEAAAGLLMAPGAANLAPSAGSSEDDEDASWESASDSEYVEEGLAWGDFMEV
jgi:invasion protein IalB